MRVLLTDISHMGCAWNRSKLGLVPILTSRPPPCVELAAISCRFSDSGPGRNPDQGATRSVFQRQSLVLRRPSPSGTSCSTL